MRATSDEQRTTRSGLRAAGVVACVGRRATASGDRAPDDRRRAAGNALRATACIPRRPVACEQRTTACERRATRVASVTPQATGPANPVDLLWSNKPMMLAALGALWIAQPAQCGSISASRSAVATSSDGQRGSRRRVRTTSPEARIGSVMIPDVAAKRLVDIATRPEYLAGARPYFAARDHWKTVDDQALWKMVLSQVCVVGNSDPWERVKKSGSVEGELSLASLTKRTPASRLTTIHRCLHRHGVRYVTENAHDCRKSRALASNLGLLLSLPGGAKGYLRELAALPNDRDRVHRVTRDWGYIKNKGARDFLIELDLGHSLLAFDVRVITVLKAAGVDVPDDVQSDKKRYEELQDCVIKRVCTPAGLSGAEFDRVVFRNYDAIRAELTSPKQGMNEALHAARQEGIAEGKRTTLARLLARANIAFSEVDRARMEACNDAPTLDRWCENVLRANSITEVLS